MPQNCALRADDGFDNVLSLNGNEWKFAAYDENEAEMIAVRYGLPVTVAAVLASRGLNTDDAGDFLDSRLQKQMPDPSVLKDMDKAAARIADAVENRERVAVIGDYDVDGATSSSLFSAQSSRQPVAASPTLPPALILGPSTKPR